MRGDVVGRIRLALLGAAVCLSAAICSTSAFPQDEVLNRDEAAAVKARVQEIRGLKLAHDVPVSYLTVPETEARFMSEFVRTVTQADIDRSLEEEKLIGLLPPGLKIERKDLADMTLEIAGLYDDRRKDIVIVDRPLMVSVPAQYRESLAWYEKLETAGTLGHELTHALQDQNFNISAAQQKYKDNSDRELAYHAIIEGDATLSGYSVTTGRVDDQTIDFFDTHLQEIAPMFMGRMEGKPPAMTYPFIFQYIDGAHFVAEAYHRKGWAGVNALFTGAPLSTQQILHPELYFDRPTAAREVKLSGYNTALQDWKKVREDTLGELMLKLMIERTMGEGTPYVQAAGRWAGDRMVALEKGKTITILWMLAFRDSGSADTFAQLYSRILDESESATAHKIDRRGPVVLAVIGAGSSRAQQLLPEVWSKSRVDDASIADQ